MPTRTTVASRRFYRAFYEWTLLNSPAAATAAGGHGHGLHTTSRAQKGLTITKVPARTAGWSRVKASGKTHAPTTELSHGEKESRGEQKPRNALDHVSDAWTTGPVHTATEKPFSTLQPYGAVVRYRSEFGLMIEVAVPEHHLKKMQMKLGNRLERLSKDYGARVEVQKLSAPAAMSGIEDARIVSVLISGTFTEAHYTVGRIRSYQIIRSTVDSQVHSHLARPSATLCAKERVFRERTATLTRMELSLPESIFMQFVATSSIDSVRKKFNVDVEVGEPELRPVDKESAETSMARSFLISGAEESVQRGTLHILDQGQVGRHAKSLEKNSSPVPSGGLLSSDGLRSKGSDQNAPSGATHPEVPKANTDLTGCSTTGLQVCRARIIGPHRASLRCMIPNTPSALKEMFDLPRSSSVSAVEADPDIIVSADRPAIERFQSQLRSRIDDLCTAKNLAPHNVEFHIDEDFDDAASRRSDLFVCRATLGGTNADHLWAVLMSDLIDGWRVYKGSEPCHIEKSASTLTLTGTSEGVGDAITHVRRRLQRLCTAFGYQPHDLSVFKQSIDPARDAQLVTKVRHALRALTHPVVLITARDPNYDHRSPKDLHKRNGRGVTVSSFNTVTLEPRPVVSFNLKLPSRAWDDIKLSQKFTAHFLSASSRGAAIADAFARTHNAPRSGFDVLREMGVSTWSANQKRVPIKVVDAHGGGVLAQIHVDLLPHKCVEVEDHLIVVGVVDDIRTVGKPTDQLALSYSMRGYRGTNGQLEPDFTPAVGEVDGTNERDRGQSSSPESDPSPPAALVAQYDPELDPLRLGEGNYVGVEQMSHPSSREEAQSASPPSDEDLDDPVYRALMSAREKVRQEEEIHLYEAFNTQGEEAPFQQLSQDKVEEHAKRAAKAQQEEEEHDFGFDEPEHASALPRHDDSHGEVSQEPPRTFQASAFSSSARGLAGSSSKRSFSTFARSLSVLPRSPLPPYRLASTLAESRTSRDMSSVLDTATAQSTVSDYLSFSDNTYDEQGNFKLYVKQVGVRGSLVAKQDITRLKDLLQRGYKVSKTGEDIAFRPDEISGIRHKIVLYERKICINLAVNAMRTLRDMLDKARFGELFWRRVPYMESLIEQGMATLMQEARELRSLLDGGKIERERYDMISARMKGRYDAMEIEVGRLRQVTEEEGDGGVKDFDDDD